MVLKLGIDGDLEVIILDFFLMIFYYIILKKDAFGINYGLPSNLYPSILTIYDNPNENK
jgi:hypothetical protein